MYTLLYDSLVAWYARRAVVGSVGVFLYASTFAPGLLSIEI